MKFKTQKIELSKDITNVVQWSMEKNKKAFEKDLLKLNIGTLVQLRYMLYAKPKKS